MIKETKKFKKTKKNSKSNRSSRSCKKCGYYDSNNSMCKAFDISVSSTRNALYCKKYSQCRSKIPKSIQYRI